MFFHPMLPTSIEHLKDSTISKLFENVSDWIIEPKIDGIRIITYVDKNGNLECYSRNGQRYHNLEKYLQNKYPWLTLKDYFIDGEIFYKNIRLSYSIISNKKQPIRYINYYVFDIFKNPGKETIINIPLETRKSLLTNLIKSKFIIINVPYVLIDTKPDKFKEYIFNLSSKYVASGWEGIVLKHKKSPYIPKRSKFWIKVKNFYSVDLRVIDVVESKKKPGTLGGVIVDACGTNILVGSGFTNKERILYWKHPELIIGKIIEIRYFEKTPRGLLRFPIFVRIRDDKDKPDKIC